MRTQRLLSCVVAVLVAAPLVTLAPSATATKSLPASTIQPCKGNQLKISIGKKQGAIRHQDIRRVTYRNTGDRCSIDTLPRLGYATKRGKLIGHLSAKAASRLPEEYTLGRGKAGGASYLTPRAKYFSAKRCQPKRAHKLITYIPGTVRKSARHVTTLRHPMKVCTTKRLRPGLIIGL